MRQNKTIQHCILDVLIITRCCGWLECNAVYPMYVVQNRLLVSPTGYYKGMLDCFARCYKEEGLRVFSQSYTVSSVRILPYKGIDIGLYGFMREKLVPEGEMPSVPLSLVMGGGASCVSLQYLKKLLVFLEKIKNRNKMIRNTCMIKIYLNLFFDTS